MAPTPLLPFDTDHFSPTRLENDYNPDRAFIDRSDGYQPKRLRVDQDFESKMAGEDLQPKPELVDILSFQPRLSDVDDHDLERKASHIHEPLAHHPDSKLSSRDQEQVSMHHHLEGNHSHESSAEAEAGIDGDREEGVQGEDDEEGEGEGEGEGSDSRNDSHSGKESPKKKPRITLARGGACVACRNRKLKCTGERPCRSCAKAKVDCRYEGVKRKKPRAVMLEERVAELEYLLSTRGVQYPGSELSSNSAPTILQTPTSVSPTKEMPSFQKRGSASTASSTQLISPPALTPFTHHDLPQNLILPQNLSAPVNTNAQTRSDITPNSSLELALIQTVLPHTPYLLMPIHPQRFLAVLGLPPNDLQRPHPAFLYILFAEAVRILENNIPLPNPPQPPPSIFPQSYTPPMPAIDPGYILQQVSGMSLTFLERARSELDLGIRNVDRPFDLARASIGIARYLYSLGRFIEGWNIPVSRLMVSCGLHRATGNIYPLTGSPNGSNNANGNGHLPKPLAPAHIYANINPNPETPNTLPVLRMRPVIIPPPADEIELAERTMVFWAGKMQDWEAGIGWGWTLSLGDEECTTEFPWGWGGVETKPPGMSACRWGIRDLYDPGSSLQNSPFPDTTYVLAVKSIGLLHGASHLFDRPESSYPISSSSGHLHPTHIPSLYQVQRIETAIDLFRKRLHPIFSYDSNAPLNPDYDGISDPWWILLHVNLYTAEMIMFKEMAHHHRKMYEKAVSCARAIVGLVRWMRPDSWVHVDMLVALDISLASRFLFKESARLLKNHNASAAVMASDEAELLKLALERDYSRYLPMASLHALIIRRVREGWAEKEGEYERF